MKQPEEQPKTWRSWASPAQLVFSALSKRNTHYNLFRPLQYHITGIIPCFHISVAGFAHISHVLKGKKFPQICLFIFGKLLSLSHLLGKTSSSVSRMFEEHQQRRKQSQWNIKAELIPASGKFWCWGQQRGHKDIKPQAVTAPSAELGMELVASPRAHLLWREAWSSSMAPSLCTFLPPWSELGSFCSLSRN